MWVILVKCYRGGTCDCNVNQEAYQTYEEAVDFVKTRSNVDQIGKFKFYDDENFIIYELKNIYIK